MHTFLNAKTFNWYEVLGIGFLMSTGLPERAVLWAFRLVW